MSATVRSWIDMQPEATFVRSRRDNRDSIGAERRAHVSADSGALSLSVPGHPGAVMKGSGRCGQSVSLHEAGQHALL